MAAIASAALPSGGLRAFVTLGFLFLVPGYLLIQAFVVPAVPGRARAVQALLATGVSPALVGLLALCTAIAEGGFRVNAIVAVVTGTCFILGGLALFRRMVLPSYTRSRAHARPGDRNAPPAPRRVPQHAPHTHHGPPLHARQADGASAADGPRNADGTPWRPVFPVTQTPPQVLAARTPTKSAAPHPANLQSRTPGIAVSRPPRPAPLARTPSAVRPSANSAARPVNRALTGQSPASVKPSTSGLRTLAPTSRPPVRTAKVAAAVAARPATRPSPGPQRPN